MKNFLNIIGQGLINLFKSLGYIILCVLYVPCYLLGLLFTSLTNLALSLMHKIW